MATGDVFSPSPVPMVPFCSGPRPCATARSRTSQGQVSHPVVAPHRGALPPRCPAHGDVSRTVHGHPRGGDRAVACPPCPLPSISKFCEAVVPGKLRGCAPARSNELSWYTGPQSPICRLGQRHCPGCVWECSLPARRADRKSMLKTGRFGACSPADGVALPRRGGRPVWERSNAALRVRNRARAEKVVRQPVDVDVMLVT